MKKTVTKLSLAFALVLGVTTPYTIHDYQANADTKYAYNEPMKTGQGATPYDFGAETDISGYFEAENEASQMTQPLTIDRITPRKANIALIGNKVPNTNQYSYGTSTAIGKHTLLTGAHVVDKHNARKSYDKADLKQLFVQPQRQGTNAPHTLKASQVDMIQGGDIALVHTKEDLSQYMQIRKLASESKIKHMKQGESLTLNHYSKKAKGQAFVNDPHGTMYQSHGQFVMRGSNIHPVTYLRIYSGKGASGGALLNKDGEITGIISAKYTRPEAERAHLHAGFNLTDEPRRNMKGKIN